MSRYGSRWRCMPEARDGNPPREWRFVATSCLPRPPRDRLRLPPSPPPPPRQLFHDPCPPPAHIRCHVWRCLLSLAPLLVLRLSERTPLARESHPASHRSSHRDARGFDTCVCCRIRAASACRSPRPARSSTSLVLDLAGEMTLLAVVRGRGGWGRPGRETVLLWSELDLEGSFRPPP